MNLIEAKIQCPYCGEPLTVLVEPLESEQSYVEDCQVCCAPMVIHTSVEEGELVSIYAEQENA